MTVIGPVIAKVQISQPRDIVWRALCDGAGSSAGWWPELKLGAARGEVVSLAGEHSQKGEIDVWVNGHALGWSWKRDGDDRATAPLITLRSVQGETLVTVTETGFDGLSDGAERSAASNAVWTDRLAALVVAAASADEGGAADEAVEGEAAEGNESEKDVAETDAVESDETSDDTQAIAVAQPSEVELDEELLEVAEDEGMGEAVGAGDSADEVAEQVEAVEVSSDEPELEEELLEVAEDEGMGEAIGAGDSAEDVAEQVAQAEEDTSEADLDEEQLEVAEDEGMGEAIGAGDSAEGIALPEPTEEWHGEYDPSIYSQEEKEAGVPAHDGELLDAADREVEEQSVSDIDELLRSASSSETSNPPKKRRWWGR